MRLIIIHKIVRVLGITSEKHTVKSLILSGYSQMVAPTTTNTIIIYSLA